MARIRTIKPEFPQSESMGRVSRDARLLFVNLWTISDDDGRARGASRLLASLLYPYDKDAADLIDGWIEELEREKCVVRYIVDGTTYLQITNWLEHQKIDKPSKSRIPEFDEASRTFAKPREPSARDLGPRTLDQDLGPKEDTADAVTSMYVFEAAPIRLTKKDFDKWQSSFSNLSLRAELLALQEWAGRQKNWFHAVQGALAKRDREVLAIKNKPPIDANRAYWGNRTPGIL